MNNRELDKWLAKNVMGWELFIHDTLPSKDFYNDIHGFIVWKKNWHPTENIAQAFECLDTLMDWEISKMDGIGRKNREFTCRIWSNKLPIPAFGQSSIVTEAICQAIYKAIKG